MIAKTFFGLEEILAEELRNIGATHVKPIKRAVAFNGDKKVIYRANYELRTALRILVPIREFPVANEEDLYRKVMNIEWKQYLDVDQTFAIDSVVYSREFTHSKYVALKVKDAIVDQFRNNTGRRPSVDTKNPHLRLHVHIRENICTLALDSSGYSLHMRNYREMRHEAPLNEVLAAGMLLIAGWKGKRDLIDPMCGSGTLLSEAALIAQKIPPGIFRKGYAFQNWKDYDKGLWKTVQREARSKMRPCKVQLLGYDQSPVTLRQAKDQLFQREFSCIKFGQSSFQDLKPPKNPGVLVMNPPYGERLDEEDTEALYKAIGDHLKKNYAGFQAWIISSNRQALKRVGLKPTRKYTLYNGPLECSYARFDLYKGSRRE